MKILLIDDNPNDRLLIKMEIEEAIKDAEIIEVSTREDFEKALLSSDYHMVLTDYLLRWSNGLEVLDRIKEINPEIPVIMVTDSGSEEVAVKAMKSGLYDYVLKKNLKRLPLSIEEAMKRKRMERELEESNRRYKIIIDTIPMAVAIIKNGKFEFINNNFLKLFKKNKNEVIGKKYYEIFSKKDLNKFETCLKSSASNPQEPKECEGKLEINGKTVWLSIFFNSFTLHGETHVLAMIMDITQKKELETQVLNAQKIEAVGNLISGIAHDFNNILSIIVGYTDILERKIIKKGRGVTYIQMIQDAGSKAKNLINDLVEFARPSDRESKPLDIVPLIKESYKLSRAVVPESIEFKISYPPDRELVVNTNPTHITQIMMNLINNAIHAIGEKKGKIEIILEEATITKEKFLHNMKISPGEYVLFKIKDTGRGIAKDMMDKIFDPYFTSKGKGAGTGLGLAMVKSIVTSMNGAIEVKSDVGKGTEFILYLPRMKRKTTHDIKKQGHENNKTGGGHIMFIDDEKIIVEVGVEILTDLGYRVSGFTDPKKAFEVFLSDPDSIDLVITDMVMPKMNGLELIGEMRKVRKDLPVIIITGYANQLNKEIAQEFNVNNFLSKPIGYKKLSKIVKEVLG